MNETTRRPLKKASGWQLFRLGDLLKRHNEIIHPGDRKDGEAVFVGLEHIEAHTGRRIGSLTLDVSKLTGRKPTFRAGQIVYGYLRPYLNKVWIADFDGCSSVDQFAFDVRNELADTAFLASFMRSETFLRRSEVLTTTGQLPRIGVDEIAAVQIELPSLSEQKRIAAELTASLAAVDKARRAARERLAAAEALPAAYLREVFEGAAASEWESRPLIELCEGSGQYGTSERSNGEERGLPVLGMPHIHDGRIRWHRISHVDLSPRDCDKYRLASGDVLFNRTNSAELVGKTAVFDGSREAVFASYLIRFRARSGTADPRFIAAYINSRQGRTFIERHMARASGQVNVSASTMHGMMIPCPPFEEQQKIGNRIENFRSRVDPVIAAVRQESTMIDALPAALLRRAFEGAIP